MTRRCVRCATLTWYEGVVHRVTAKLAFLALPREPGDELPRVAHREEAGGRIIDKLGRPLDFLPGEPDLATGYRGIVVLRGRPLRDVVLRAVLDLDFVSMGRQSQAGLTALVPSPLSDGLPVLL